MIHTITPNSAAEYVTNTVFYDEIVLYPENSMHPAKQRVYVDEIRKKSGVILIVTFSPFIIQQADVVIHHTGKVIEKDFKLWRVDQILRSEVFGLESLRSVHTEELLAEKSNLIKIKHEKPEVASRIKEIDNEIGFIPYAESPADIEAMELIHKIAKKQK